MKTLLAAALFSTTAFASAFDSAFDSAFESALGLKETIHDITIDRLESKRDAQEEGSPYWNIYDKIIQDKQQAWIDGLPDLYEQITQDLADNGIYPDVPPMPEPEPAPEPSETWQWGYNGDGGPASLEKMEDPIIVWRDSNGEVHSTIKSGCEAMATEPVSEWSFFGAGWVHGAYAELPGQEYKSISLQGLRQAVFDGDTHRVECWSNPTTENPYEWNYVGALFYDFLPTYNADCPLYDTGLTYEQVIPTDGETKWEVKMDLDRDGIADMQRDLVGPEFEGLGFVHLNFTYGDIANAVPDGFLWTGPIAMQIYGIKEEGLQEEVVSSAVLCMQWGDAMKEGISND